MPAIRSPNPTNTFRLTGLVRKIDVDARLDLQVLLQFGKPPVDRGYGPSVAHAVVLSVPADREAMLADISELDVIAVRGRIEGFHGDGDEARERLSGIGSTLPVPAYGYMTQLVAEQITKLKMPASRFESIRVQRY